MNYNNNNIRLQRSNNNVADREEFERASCNASNETIDTIGQPKRYVPLKGYPATWPVAFQFDGVNANNCDVTRVISWLSEIKGTFNCVCRTCCFCLYKDKVQILREVKKALKLARQQTSKNQNYFDLFRSFAEVGWGSGHTRNLLPHQKDFKQYAAYTMEVRFNNLLHITRKIYVTLTELVNQNWYLGRDVNPFTFCEDSPLYLNQLLNLNSHEVIIPSARIDMNASGYKVKIYRETDERIETYLCQAFPLCSERSLCCKECTNVLVAYNAVFAVVKPTEKKFGIIYIIFKSKREINFDIGLIKDRLPISCLYSFVDNKIISSVDPFMKETVLKFLNPPILNESFFFQALLSDFGIPHHHVHKADEEQYEAFLDLSHDINDNLTLINDAIKKVTNLTQSIQKEVSFDPKTVAVGVILASGAVYFAGKYTDNRIMKTLAALGSLYFTDEIIKLIPTKNETDYYAQAGDFFPIAKLIMGISSFLYSNDFSKYETNSKVFKSIISDLPKFTTNFYEIVGSIAKSILKVIEAFGLIDASNPLYKFCASEPKYIIDWASEVTSFTNSILNGKLAITMKNYETFLALQEQGHNIMRDVCGTKDGANYKTYINEFMRDLFNLKDRFASAHLSYQGPRVCPVTVCLFGNSGVGKSTMTFPFSHDVADRFLSEEDRALLKEGKYKLVYPMNAENEYCDDYSNELVTLMDEFGQPKDIAGNPDNEWMKFIRMANTFPWNMHCAEIHNKNRKRFTSKLILLSTNLKEFRPNSVVSIEAIYRRIDFPVFVVPKLEWCIDGSVQNLEDRRLDQSKLKKGEFIEDVYEFHVVSFNRHLNREITGEVLTYNQLLDKVSNKMKMNVIKHETYISSMNGRFKNWQEPVNQTETFVAQGAFDKYPRVEDINFDTDEQEQVLETKAIARLAVMNHLLQKGIIDSHYNVNRCYHVIEPLVDELVAMEPRRWEEVKSHIFHEVDMALRNLHWPDEMDRVEVSCSFKDAICKYFCDIKVSAQGLYDRVMRSKKICALLSILGLVSGFSVIGNLFSGDKVAKEEIHFAEYEPVNSGKKGKSTKGYQPRKAKNSNTNAKLNDIVAEGGLDIQSKQISDSVMRSNSYTIHWMCDTRFGTITFVKGLVAMMPRHFIEEIYNKPDDYIITLKKYEGGRTYTFKVSEIRSWPTTIFDDTDLMVLKFPNVLPNHKDITKFFVDSNYINRFEFFNVFLHMKQENCYRSFGCRATRIDGEKIKYGEEGIYKECSGLLRYQAYTTSGDCGALCFINDTGSNCKKIIGIHIAGTASGMGLSVIVTKEDIDNLLEDYPSEISVILDTEFTPQSSEYKDVPYSVHGYTEKRLHMPSRSIIRPSELHGSWGEPTTLPVKLSRCTLADGTIFDPMEHALSKYNKNSVIYNEELLEASVAAVFRDISLAEADTLRSKPMVRDYFTSVQGIPGSEFFRGISRQTAAGYPWINVLPKGTKGKTSIYGSEGDYDFGGKYELMVRKSVEKLIEQGKQRIAGTVIYKDFIKDERYPIEKIKKGKARLVSGAPVDYVIAFRMYFIDFMSSIMENRISNGIAVGINPYGEDWNYLASHLIRYKDNIIAGDFSAYDGCMTTQMARMILKYINLWYNDGIENSIVRESLFHHLYNSTHINGAMIYSWDGSLPSGHPMTVIMNSIVGRVLTRMAFAERFGIVSINDFYRSNVYDIQYGDDNVMGVSEIIKDEFNQEYLTAKFAEYGYKYTDDQKREGFQTSLRSLSEIQFLKRSFRYEPKVGRYVAPLTLNTVLEMPYWVKSKTHEDEITKSVFHSALHELSLHSIDTWNEFFSSMKKGYEETYNRLEPIDKDFLMNITLNYEWREEFEY